MFSLTVVAPQLGSSQYSPRLLQTFVSGRVVHEAAWRAPRGRLSTDLRELMDRVADLPEESTAIGAPEIRSWLTDLDEAMDGRWRPAP
jgi:hypothetical protein